MTTNKELLYAILAMDSYNRLYGEGIEGLGGAGSKVGEATLLKGPTGSDINAWKSVGFYAAAYDTGTGTVISYRGTDSYFGNGGDVLNGWIIATGQQTGQSALALEFYKSATGKSVFEGDAGNVTVTGHSLGGGLAGLVSWLSGAEGLLFDHMPFGIAASIIAAQGEQPQSPPTGGGSQSPKRELHTDAAEGEYVKGEVLQAVRNGTLVGALATLPPSVLNALADWLGVPVDPDDPQLSVIEMALKIRAAESLVPQGCERVISTSATMLSCCGDMGQFLSRRPAVYAILHAAGCCTPQGLQGSAPT
jgi:hypothetical protein